MLAVTQPTPSSLRVEYRTAGYIRGIGLMLMGVGALMCVGAVVLALGFGAQPGLASAASLLIPSLMIGGLGVVLARNSAVVVTTFDFAAAKATYERMRWRAAPERRELAFSELIGVSTYTTVNYVSLRLDLVSHERLDLVLGEPRSDAARKAVAQVLAALGQHDLHVETDTAGTWVAP